MSLIACVFAPPRAAGASAVAAALPATDEPAPVGDDGFQWGLLDTDSAAIAATATASATARRQRERSGRGLGTLQEALGEHRPDHLTLVLPGEDVLATRVSVPARSRRQFEAALPYVVEEFLAEDVDGLHIAAGVRDRDGQVAVRVLAPEVLRAALDALAMHGLGADAARVDHDALPVGEADHCELWLDEARALIRTGDTALAIDRDDLLAVLPMVLRRDAAAGSLTLQIRATEATAGNMDLAEIEPLLGQQAALDAASAADSGAGIRIERATLDGSLVEALTLAFASSTPAAGISTGGADNASRAAPELLTGPYRVRTAAAAQRFGRWRLVAGLAVAWLLVELILDSARISWLEARTDDLRAESVALFRELYPDRTRIPDPRRELEALLGPGAAAGSESFMVLLGVLSAAAGELDERVALRSVNFNAERGDLAIDLSAPGIATVDRLKAALERIGYPISIDSAVQETNGVRARMRMRAQGGRT